VTTGADRGSEQAYPELRWLERGEGEPVVLLPGLMSRMDHWEASLEELGRACRAIALSLPIFDARLAEPSIGELARHVARFLEALDIPRAVVGGNSLGGHVALELALSHPERVSGLILTGSSGLFERGFTRHVPHRPTADYVRAKMEEVVYDPLLITPAWVECVRQIVTTRATALRVLRFARAARRNGVGRRLPGLAAPALLIWGREDRITPPPVAERFLALLPDAELWLLARCGHAPMLERPRAFGRIAAAWLHATRGRREALARVAGGVR
jgi:pimeloyl-ACP methyl ester carboxylesterase